MKILLVAHVFYPQLWPELATCIRNVAEPKDVVITYVDEAAVVEARRDFQNARFVLCENRGYDIWPFLKVLQQTDLSAYDLVVKLHTKRDIDFGFDFRFNGYHFNGSAWRNRLLSFCRTDAAWRRTRSRFNDPNVGMVADHHLIVGRDDVRYDHARRAYDAALSEVATLGGGQVAAGRGRFVAGTMFAVRTEALAFLQKRGFRSEMFPPSEHVRPDDCQYAHVVERMLGLAVCACGLRIVSADGILKRIWSRLTCR